MLTGGRSSKQFYNYWKKTSNFKNLSGEKFYLTDERFVPINHKLSNYKMISQVFKNSSNKMNINFINCKSEVPNKLASKYEKKIPRNIDIIFLSVGEDGHIASLFPKKQSLKNKNKFIFVKNCPKLPSERFTITPRVIQNARNVILLVNGKKKGAILVKALENQNNFFELPVRLTLGRTWFLDKIAFKEFQMKNKNKLYKTKIIYE